MAEEGFKIADAFVDVHYKTDAAEADLAAALSGKTATINVTADTAAAKAEIAALRDTAVAPVEIGVSANLEDAAEKVAVLREEIETTSAAMPVEADTEPADVQVDALRARVAEAAEMPVAADTIRAQEQIAEVRTEVLEPESMPIGANTDGARAEIDQLRADQAALAAESSIPASEPLRPPQQVSAIDPYSGQSRVPVDADTSQATAAVATFREGASTPVVVPVEADDTKADAEVVSLRARVAEAIRLIFTGDTSEAEQAYASLRAQVLDALHIQVSADTGEALTEVGELRAAAVAASTPIKVTATGDVGEAEQKLADLKAEGQQLAIMKATVQADIAEARSNVAQIEGELKEATGHPYQADLELEAAQARTDLADLEVQLRTLTRAQIEVTADTTDAQAKLAAAKAEADALDGKLIDFTVDAEVSSALQKLAMVTTQIAGISLGVTAGIGAIAGLGSVIGGGMLTLVSGLSGVTRGVEALGMQQTMATGTAAKMTSGQDQLTAALDRVKQAQAGLANTEANNANAAISAAESVANARESAANSIRTADQAVVQTQRDVVAANQAVSESEYSLSEAQQSEQRAQQSLTDAREAAQRQLESLEQQTEDMALSQRGSALAVQQAKLDLDKVMADPRNSELQREQAQLTYDQAVQQQKDLAQQATNLAADKQKADQQGIDGSAQVISAEQQLEQAQHSVADATLAVAKAQQSVVDAVQKAAQAQQTAAQTQIDEQRKIADAVRAQVEQQRQAAYSVEQAKDQIVSAQLAVKTATVDAGNTGGAAMNRINDALDHLSPAARAFAEYLRGFIDGPLRELRQAGQEGLFPGLEGALKGIGPSMREVEPEFRSFSALIGGVLGDAIKGIFALAPSFLRFASVALEGLSPLRGAFVTFGAEFEAMVKKVTADGSLKGAMSGIAQVIGAVIDYLPKIIPVGLELLKALGPPLAAALNAALPGFVALAQAMGPLLVGVVKAITPLLTDLSNVLVKHPQLAQAVALGILGMAAGIKLINPLIGILNAGFAIFTALMDADPIVLVGLALVALGVGIYQAYQHSATFRAEVQQLWQVIQQWGAAIAADVMPALSDLWDTIQKQVVPALGDFVTAITPVVTWLVDHLGPVVSAVFDFIIKVIKGALQIISGVIEVFAGLLTGDWSKVWTGVKEILSGIWTAIEALLKDGWKILVDLFTTAGSLIANVWDGIWKDVKNAAVDIWHYLETGFRSTVSAIATIWKDLENAAKVPINFIIGTVYDKGIVPLVNDVGGLIGLHLSPLATFASGGRLPGYGGGDTVPALLEPGETVVSKEHTTSLAPVFRAAGVPGFAAGGLIGDLEGVASSALNGLEGLAGSALGAAASKLLMPLLAQIPGQDTTLGKDLVGIPQVIVKALLGKLSTTGGAPPAPANVSGAVSIGQQMAAAMGWTGMQWNDLYALWMRESSWNYQARNPSSGAYGIPQSLPPSKMASAGSDWLSNPATQIRWGLDYIAQRYGNPAGAWAHEGSAGWYDQGGYLPPGLSIVGNGTGKPEPVLTSQQWDAVSNGGGKSINVGELHVHLPAQAMKLSLLSPTDRLLVARDIRDQLVKLEGGTRS